MRGDEAFSLYRNLSALSGEDARRALQSFWRKEENWVDATDVDWRYEEKRKSIILTMSGTARPDWSGNDKDGHSLTIWGAGFSPPERLYRPREQDASAPWLTNFPRFRCWASTIRLPRSSSGHAWSFKADAMDRKIGGVQYWRQAGLQGLVMRTVMSRNVELAEITAQQAKAQNEAVPGFDNSMSRVFEDDASPSGRSLERLPFEDHADWLADDHACAATPAK
jgi:hypothetical protein